MRRLVPGILAVVLLTGLLLVVPVFGPSGPEPVPVPTSAEEVALGSVLEPSPAAQVQLGPSQHIDGVAEDLPVLRLARTDVPEFSLVGVTWKFDPAVTDTVVQVRVQDLAGEWGTWTQVGIEDAGQNPDADSGRQTRLGTAPLWTGPATGVEVELATRSGAQPVDVELDLIDPGESEADAALETAEIQDTADAAGMPDVFSRAQWGADERLRTWGPEYAGVVKAATVHHTADSNAYSIDEVPGIMRSIYRYHAVSLGWGDIGYNVIVDKFGRLWEGRSGGLASTVIGAHAGGFNTGTFGVSMLGNYDIADPSPETINSVAAIISWKLNLYGVNPRGTTTLTSGGGGTAKYAKGTRVTLPTVFAHRDVGATACPGRYAFSRMDQIRDKVAGTYVDVTQISQRYDSEPALRTALGSEVTAPRLTSDGSGAYAHYQRGSLFYSRATGVRMVAGPIRDLWSAIGWEGGVLQYPTSDVTATADGAGQYAHFQGGSIYWSPETGARAMFGPIRDLWVSTGGERGGLGYPTTSVSLAGDGVGHYAHFERGTIIWSSSTGARAVLGPIRDLWAAGGWERSELGYPTTSVSTAPDGVGQYAHFQGGSVYWTAQTGAQAVYGPVQELWQSTGGEAGGLGYPTTSVAATADEAGTYARFQGGSIYWTAETGARALLGPIGEMWRADGAEQGSLGYPVMSVSSTPDRQGHYAHFQHGSAYWTAGTGAHAVLGPIRTLWASTGAERGGLGYPTSTVAATADGAGEFATFTNGSIYSTPETGTRAMLGPVGALWASTGAEAGVLGYPITSVSTTPDGKGHYAHFQGGSILWTPQTGAGAVMGPIRDLWASTGGERGGLGYPTSSVAPTADGTGLFARFQGGSIYWTADTGARAVLGPVQALWNATGGERGGLGYPTSSVSTTRDGKGHYAHFEGGSIYWTAQTGARAMLGPVAELWLAEGAERGVLGYPTTSVSTAADGVGNFAHFQGGSIYWSPSTGAHVVRGALRDAWAATGWERGRLGYPTSAAYPVNGGTRMDFSKGILTISTRTGQVFVEVRSP